MSIVELSFIAIAAIGVLGVVGIVAIVTGRGTKKYRLEEKCR
jgi:hypothetical protein